MTGNEGIAIDRRKAWVVVTLLFFYSVINFFDKLVLGLAAVPIMKELQLDPAQYGLVASSFYWLYAVSGVIVGLFVINRVRSKWLLVALVAIWSIAQAPIAFTSSLMVLVACRILLGIGEGPGTPSAYEAAHSWFESKQRNLPTAIIIQGTSVGFLLGAPILTYVIVDYGWRHAFLLCSVLGVIWIVAWLMFGADGPISVHAQSDAGAAPARVPWSSLWFDRTMIGSYIVGFGSYWMVGLSIAWLAPFLQTGLGYDARAVGWVVSAMHAVQPVIVIGLSILSERALRRGATSRTARANVNAGCLILAGCCFATAMSIEGSGFLKVALLALGFQLPMITFVLGPAMVSEVAPTAQRGTALLVTYSVITVAGFISPAVVGFVLKAAGPQAVGPGYTQAFLVSAAVLVVSGLAGFVFLHPDASRRRLEAVAQGEEASLALAPRSATAF
jgi:MFS family permease